MIAPAPKSAIAPTVMGIVPHFGPATITVSTVSAT